MKRTFNIAHRGFSGHYPENSMLAFKKAVEAGCDGIETDLQLTKDGVIVIFHDEVLTRITGESGLIKDYSYSELLKFDICKNFNSIFEGIRIPNIDEFFDFIKDKNLIINLELKNGIINYEKLEEMVIKKIYDYNLKEKVIFSSFNHYSMVHCKEIDNTIKTGLLYDAGLYHPEKYAKYVGADAVHPYFYSVLHKEVVEPIQKEGIMINTYTVNEENHMKRLIELGIDGIITNYPDKLAKLLSI